MIKILLLICSFPSIANDLPVKYTIPPYPGPYKIAPMLIKISLLERDAISLENFSNELQRKVAQLQKNELFIDEEIKFLQRKRESSSSSSTIFIQSLSLSEYFEISASTLDWLERYPQEREAKLKSQRSEFAAQSYKLQKQREKILKDLQALRAEIESVRREIEEIRRAG